jgi:hypothetical protein
MRHSVFGILILVLSLTGMARAENIIIKLESGDAVSLEIDESLEILEKPASAAQPKMICVRARKGACELRIKFGPREKSMTEDQVRQMLMGGAQRLLANSVEDKVDIVKLQGTSITLLYFELTDKREDAQDGRFMLQGFGTFGNLACQFMMLTEQKESESKTAILKALGTLTMIAKK